MSTPNTQTHTSRRLKYATNVIIAAAVALAIVVVINIIGYRQNARFDFTVTREYTLSPQTQAVLKQLDEDVEIATVFPVANTMLRRVQDLTLEYERASGDISVTHIDPSGNPSSFYKRISERFSETNQPLTEAVQNAHPQLEQAQGKFQAILESLSQAAEQIPGDSDPVKDRLLNASGTLVQVDRQITGALEQVKQALDSPLPDLSGAKSVL